MRPSIKRSALLFILAAPAAVYADEADQWYLTPQAGILTTDNDRLLEDHDMLYGLGFGKHLNDAWSLELNLNYSRIDTPTSGSDVEFNAASLDVLRVFNRAGVLSPYITLGAGGLQNDLRPGGESKDFMAQAGVGLMWKLWQSASGTSSFALRPEVKARWDDAGAPGYYRDYIGTLGFQFGFGGTPARAPEPAAPPPPPPQPAPPPPPPPPPPPMDTDHDGVTDDKDQCPGTPAGVSVDAVGCPQKGSITLEGVTFEVNSAQLTAASKPVLDDVAEGLRKHPRLRVELQGHTDSSGSDAYNMKLSQRRAETVRDYFLSGGVPAGQLVARGYGETQPISDNTSNEGRSKNRRVVMYVIQNPGDVNVQGEGQVK